MNASPSRHSILRERVVNAAALLVLLALGALALMGPSGILAWGENVSQLEQHQARIAHLREERATLRNRVALLDPDNVDGDLASELVRRDLNVAHPDEYVVELEGFEQP